MVNEYYILIKKEHKNEYYGHPTENETTANNDLEKLRTENKKAYCIQSKKLDYIEKKLTKKFLEINYAMKTDQGKITRRNKE